MARRARGLPAALAGALLVLGLAAASNAGDDSDVYDPWEPMNRGIFWFNEQLDFYFLRHVSRGYEFVVPEPARKSVRNFFRNVGFPIWFSNNLLQGKPVAAAEEVARFLINSTVGVAGLFDAADHSGLEWNEEDFGQTLGVWGIPQGPFLVLPILGPSSVRDGVGLAVDSTAAVYNWFIPVYASFAIASGRVFNQYSLDRETIEEERRTAFDFYAKVRNAYLANRRKKVADSEEEEPPESDEDLYYFDDEEEE